MKSRQVDFLLDLFDAAVGSANPSKCLPPHLPGRNPAGRTVIFGAGKAAASMARVVEKHWEGALSGLAITPYRHRLPCKWVEVLEAGHPLPDRERAGSGMLRRGMAALVIGLVCDLLGSDPRQPGARATT